MQQHNVRRVLVEFEVEGRSFELEIKNIEQPNGKFDLTLIHNDPDSISHRLPVDIVPQDLLHSAILEIRVIKHNEDDDLYEIREVHGS